MMLAAMGTAARAGEVVGALAAAVILYKLLVWAERNNHRVEVLTAVVALLLIESLLYDQNAVPVGPFHPRLAGQNFRLYDVLFPIALVARVRVRGMPKRISALGGTIMAFCLWYFCSAILGEMRGYGFQQVLYDAKLILYLGGGYALAAGVSARDLLGPHGLRRLVRPLALYILFPVFITKSGVQPDAATLVVSLGFFTIFAELSEDHPRPTFLVAGVVLLTAPLGSHQRAALLALGASAIVAIVAPLIRSIRPRRTKVTPTEVGVVVFVIAGLVISYPLLHGHSPLHLKDYPLGKSLSRLGNSTAKQESATDRVREIKAMTTLIAQNPWIGWGLAIPISYTVAATNTVVTTSSPDELYLDLILRSGIIGMVLFAAVVLVALVWAVRAWRRSPHPGVAAVGWAAFAILAGLLARASVEALFEKYRLAVLMGLALGMIYSSATTVGPQVRPSRRAARSAPGPEPEPIGELVPT